MPRSRSHGLPDRRRRSRPPARSSRCRAHARREHRGHAAVGHGAGDDDPSTPPCGIPIRARHVEGRHRRSFRSGSRRARAVDKRMPRSAGRESPLRRKVRIALRCAEISGPPPRPGTSVKWVETMRPPRRRTRSASGFSLAGRAACPRSPGRLARKPRSHAENHSADRRSAGRVDGFIVRSFRGSHCRAHRRARANRDRRRSSHRAVRESPALR